MKSIKDIKNDKNLLKSIGCFAVAILLIMLTNTGFVYGITFTIVRVLTVIAIGAGIFFLVIGRSKKKEQIKEQKEQIQQSIKEDAMYTEADEDMNKEIKVLQDKMKLFKTIIYISAAVGFGLIVLGTVIPGIIIIIFVTCPAAFAEGTCTTKLKKFVSSNIVQQALEDVFDNITYEPTNHLSDGYVHNSHMGIPSYDYVNGSDYVKGTYKGLNVEMSDITLVKEERRLNEEGNEEKTERDVFKGLWLVCDFDKELAADMRLWRQSKSLFGKKGIQTDNEMFNKKFHIESQIEQEAFYILTPHMMEYILEMDKKAAGTTHMCFARGGKMQIAINSGRDSFEVGKNEVDATLLRKKFVNEIRYVTDIIDELRLVDTFYRK